MNSNAKGPKQISRKPNDNSQDPRLKKLWQFLEYLYSPMAIGVYVTLSFVFFAQTFYHVRSQNEAGVNQSKFTNLIFQTVEGFDFIFSDARFNFFRGEIPQNDSRVALLAIDDESLEVVGRWPWDRQLMANLIERLVDHGVKAIALDIIWSEPQENSSIETLNRLSEKLKVLGPTGQQALAEELARPQPDDVLAETIKKHADKIVLGIFPTDENERFFLPYTDYCRNEAFNRINGSIFVKADNITLSVEDTADFFEPVKFNEAFEQIFNAIEKKGTQSFLDRVGKKSEAELTNYEKNRMRNVITTEIMNYCDRWLVTSANTKPGGDVDEQYDFWLGFFKILTSTDPAQKAGLVTSKFEVLNGLTPEQAIETFKRKSLSHPVPQHKGWTINLAKLHDVAQFSGSFKADQDNDGKIRRNPLFYRTGNRIGSSFIPSLALQTYLIANPGYQAQVEIGIDPKNPTQKIIQGFRIADVTQDEDKQEVVRIPVDGQGRLKIDYAGPSFSYAHISAKELFTDSPEMRIDQRSLQGIDPVTKKPRNIVNKNAFLKDKIIMIGATAVGIYDLRVTPFEKNFPGPETHVNVLDNLVRSKFIRVDPNEATTMIWALSVLGVLVSAGVAFSGPLMGLSFVMLMEGALIWLDQMLFKKGLVTTMTLPGLLVLTLFLVMTVYKYFTEERKKKQLRSTFSKYVSPAIVDEILKSPENIELGGKKQRMSVFFSDVRGFTTFSEKLDPQMLSHVLNLYLTPMTQIVFANKGTLDKYMGDAVMAFFGAPISYPDHAKYACRCALQSINKLKDLQKEFAAEGLPVIDIGIGINTSEMNVGNMGSDTVRSYTVMGDGVNLGSRLEGINKEYGTRIIISEFTQGDVKDSFSTREIDWVRVKGKNKPIRIFELISEGAPPADWKETLEQFQAGFKEYHQKNFSVAIKHFEKCVQLRPDDEPAKLYVERCETYLQEPPPPEWDGVYVMKTK